MKYKVGDNVRVRSKEWYDRTKSRYGDIECGNFMFYPKMSHWCGEIITIAIAFDGFYKIKEDNGELKWTDEMIEGLVEEEEIEFTEEDKYWCDIMSESDPTTYVLPQGYQFKDENGNVINATKIVLEKKKEYPKTFEECVHVLEGENRMSLEQMNTFRKLIDARNAYWKIAGEKMGLGKPWKPSKDKMVYSFYRHSNKIETNIFSGESVTFEFPTEEMREAFYENFKSDIEICKELL